MSDLAAAALRYAGLGIPVFPLRPRDKKPYGRTVGLKAGAAIPELVEGWWSGREALIHKPEADEPNRTLVYAGRFSNIGIPTGKAAGFWVLDLDGATAEAGLAQLIAVHGELPVTPEQRTGGGRQLCFAWDDAWQIRNSAG
jgi:hypothetical protein